jgi:glycosyltransferase involved in cell wall biosynthesis
LANLFHEVEEHSKLRIYLRRQRMIRGLERASRVIAVSEATRRDVEKLAFVAPHRLRVVYNAPDPEFEAPSGAGDCEERRRIMERYQIEYPFLLYAGNIRRTW